MSVLLDLNNQLIKVFRQILSEWLINENNINKQ